VTETAHAAMSRALGAMQLAILTFHPQNETRKALEIGAVGLQEQLGLPPGPPPGWIAHRSEAADRCPVSPGTRIRVQFRDGHFPGITPRPEKLRWGMIDGKPGPHDITAWQLVVPAEGCTTQDKCAADQACLSGCVKAMSPA
jgi:hypothetical protein